MRIKGAVAVVTGASSGIGRATALALADRGAHVVLTARRDRALREVADECSARGAAVVVCAADTTDAAAVEDVARRAVDRFGRLDVWVNAAAVTAFGPFLEMPLADFRRVLDVNVMGYVHGARAALSYLRQQDSGVLVNVSSVLGAVSMPYGHGYAMSKFAVRALSGSLRQELRLDGLRGVKVCTVMPASIDTPMFQNAANYTGRKVRAMPPVYSPERVARTIVGVVRLPRREVVVGPLGHALVQQAKLAPGLTERLVALYVERTHLGKEPTGPTSGNLYDPADSISDVHGGWHGSRQTALRRAGVAAAVAGGMAVRRRLR